jgi:hypothetical protein
MLNQELKEIATNATKSATVETGALTFLIYK